MASLRDIPGYAARPMRRDDVAGVTALLAACEIDATGVVEIGEDDVATEFSVEGLDPQKDTVVVLAPGGEIVGSGRVYQARAEGDVHPEHRGRGIGSALLSWTEERARELGVTTLRQIPADGSHEAAFLLASGYRPGKIAWVLEYPFTGSPPAAVPVPDGITIRPYAPGSDDRAAYELIEAAFGEWPGRHRQTFEEWASHIPRHGAFAPALSRMAFDGDRLVGAALCFDYDGYDEGWVQQLATRASHRHRGIARALLGAAFTAFYERGKKQGGLSTDSETGALGLYERIGMRVRRSYTNVVKDL